MSVIAGDIIEITYNHPTIGSGVFFPKAAEDSTFDPGGFRGNDDANQIDGGGNMITQLNQVRWSFEGPISWDMNVSNELETLNKLSASPLNAEWTITHVNGTVWAGTGRPVGDIQGNGNTGMITLKLAGGKGMKKQA
jgi:hypothetical protein